MGGVYPPLLWNITAAAWSSHIRTKQKATRARCMFNRCATGPVRFPLIASPPKKLQMNQASALA